MVDTLLRHLPAHGARADRVAHAAAARARAHARARRGVRAGLEPPAASRARSWTRLFREVYQPPLARRASSPRSSEATLGWPTAVHLVHESLRARPTTSRLEDVLTELPRLEPRAARLPLVRGLRAARRRRRGGCSSAPPRSTRFDAELAATLSGIRSAARARSTRWRAAACCAPSATGAQRSLRVPRPGAPLRAPGDRGARRDPTAWRALEADTAHGARARAASRSARCATTCSPARVEDAARLVRELAPGAAHARAAPRRCSSTSPICPPSGARRPRRWRSRRPTRSAALGAVGRGRSALYQAALERARRDAASASSSAAPCSAWARCSTCAAATSRCSAWPSAALGHGRRISTSSCARACSRSRPARTSTWASTGPRCAILDEVRSSLADAADPELLVPTVHNLAMALRRAGPVPRGLARSSARRSPRCAAPARRARRSISRTWRSCSPSWASWPRRGAPAEEGLAGGAAVLEPRAGDHLPRGARPDPGAERRPRRRARRAATRRGAERRAAHGADRRRPAGAARPDLLRARRVPPRGRVPRTRRSRGCAARPDDPRLIEFQATLAWCELRAGRVHVARDLLPTLVRARRRRRERATSACASTTGSPRRCSRWARSAASTRTWPLALGAGARARLPPLPQGPGARGAGAAAARAGAAASRSRPSSAALVEAGAAIEKPLLELLADAPTAVGEAALAVLGEVGGPAAREALERARGDAPRAASPRSAPRSRTSPSAWRAAPRAARRPSCGRARLVLFGPPRLEIDGRPVPASAWRAQRAFQMLVYLALHPRGAEQRRAARALLARAPGGGRPAQLPSDAVLHPQRAAARRRGADPARGRVLSAESRLSADLRRVGARARARGGARARAIRATRRDALASRGGAGRPAPFLEGLYDDWADELQARMRDRVEKLLLELGAAAAPRPATSRRRSSTSAAPPSWTSSARRRALA